MHGSLFRTVNLFLCADLRPDPVIVTTRLPVWFVLNQSSQQQSHFLGNDFPYFHFSDLLDSLMTHDLCITWKPEILLFD